MKILLTFFLLCIAQTSFSQKDTLWLKGVLEDDVIQNVGCGVAILSFPGKIKIEEFSDTTYRNEEIIVLFVCPDDFEYNKLIGGNTYEIILSNNESSLYGIPVQNTMVPEHFEHVKEFNDDKVVWAVEWRRITK